jgi:hypothetical protein
MSPTMTEYEYDLQVPHPDVTICTAHKLHAEKKYTEAFRQFELLADGAEPALRQTSTLVDISSTIE